MVAICDGELVGPTVADVGPNVSWGNLLSEAWRAFGEHVSLGARASVGGLIVCIVMADGRLGLGSRLDLRGMMSDGRLVTCDDATWWQMI